MEFRLTFPVQSPENRINYRDKLLLMGSCFAENIGERMQRYAFNIGVNPNGITYNPISIANTISRLLADKEYSEAELFYHNELWSSWEHHGRYSNTDKSHCIRQINTDYSTGSDFVKTGQWLIVTFGSAWAYRLRSTGQVVNNCHKYPNKEFDKILLSPEEIIKTWQGLFTQIKSVNPGLSVIFTVSPVRYVRDGVAENNLSKAILLQSVHALCKSSGTYYFPAYELVIDDLRDYRFFEADLVHPNRLGIDYVWEKLLETCMDDESRGIYPQVKSLKEALEHRPFNPDTESHKKFVGSTQRRKDELLKKYPFLKV
ncbi:MAG TPA: GSCFA domain-containing protein [Bacteroidia bacterium]|nr:GSCFA domain-containing protein [Bacteroidia bacterium]